MVTTCIQAHALGSRHGLKGGNAGLKLLLRLSQVLSHNLHIASIADHFKLVNTFLKSALPSPLDRAFTARFRDDNLATASAFLLSLIYQIIGVPMT